MLIHPTISKSKNVLSLNSLIAIKCYRFTIFQFSFMVCTIWKASDWKVQSGNLW